LQEKISAATLDELLLVRLKSKYVSSLDEKQEELNNLLKLAEASVANRIKEISFEDLISIKLKYSNDLFEINNLVRPILRDNIVEIVNRFIRSGTFKSADSNASLLLEVADFLNYQQWDYILKAFCKNKQIYGSYRCPSIFYSLLKKSVELNGSLQPYWLSFRKNLDKFNDPDIERLKLLIDSYQEVE
jgi:hypothetical protein